jgi:hypothetical protein
MNTNKKLSLIAIILLFLSACSLADSTTSVTEQMEGIELNLSIEKQDYSLNEKIVAKVSVTNHNNKPTELFIPIPKDVKESIAGVIVERQNETKYQILSPIEEENITNIVGRSYYDYVYVVLDSKETIEQEFIWNQDLINQETQETIKAQAGQYIISSFIVLDEIDEQLEYYEPKNQLISKLTFSIIN